MFLKHTMPGEAFQGGMMRAVVRGEPGATALDCWNGMVRVKERKAQKKAEFGHQRFICRN